jgi:hypothetical protein
LIFVAKGHGHFGHVHGHTECHSETNDQTQNKTEQGTTALALDVGMGHVVKYSLIRSEKVTSELHLLRR